jgi:hypothetical protein
MIPVFWYMGRQDIATRTLACCGLCVALTLPLVGIRAWEWYFSRMSHYPAQIGVSGPPAPILFDGVNVQPYLEGKQFESVNMTWTGVSQFRVSKWIAAHI